MYNLLRAIKVAGQEEAKEHENGPSNRIENNDEDSVVIVDQINETEEDETLGVAPDWQNPDSYRQSNIFSYISRLLTG